MSSWTKEELEGMLEEVVNELNLSDSAIETHGPMGTSPAELVRLVLEEKDKKIRMLMAGLNKDVLVVDDDRPEPYELFKALSGELPPGY
jgi:hypothetical protein